MGRVILKRSIILGIIFTQMSAVSFADPRNYTLDLDSESSKTLDLSGFDFVGQDPWTKFFSNLSGSSKVTWGINLEGKAPYQKNLSKPMMPASVMKMVTAAAALKSLGRDAKFENYFEGEVSGKILSLPRFTVSGDPTWGHEAYEGLSDRIQNVVNQLKAAGVTEVRGPIEVVSTHSFLNQIPKSKGWPTRWNLQCMATLPTSFMFNGNCGTLKIRSRVSAVWMEPGLQVPVQLNLTRGRSNQTTIVPVLDDFGRVKTYQISGAFASSQVFSLPVHPGDSWLKNLFTNALTLNGIAFKTDSTKRPVLGERFYVDLSSRPLIDIIRVAVQASINSILDRTYFETAAKMQAQNSNEPSLSILSEVGGDPSLLEGIMIQDGSGLVVDDRLRPDTLLRFLKGLPNQNYFSDFVSTLAVAGKAGTLRNRLTGPITNGRIFGKTGTIDGVYNLAGFFGTPGEHLEPFVILTESAFDAGTVRGMIDRVVTQFAGLNQSLTLR